MPLFIDYEAILEAAARLRDYAAALEAEAEDLEDLADLIADEGCACSCAGEDGGDLEKGADEVSTGGSVENAPPTTQTGDDAEVK